MQKKETEKRDVFLEYEREICKKNHPVTPGEVDTVFNTGILEHHGFCRTKIIFIN